MSLVLDEHRTLLGDRVRIDAFARATAAVVRPGDVVVDLGSGTGILALLACRAGAARVYSIEARDIVGLARELAAANGFSDRITFLRSPSLWADLPERADVLVSDQIGRFGFEGGIVEAYADACARLLRPNARVIPQRIGLHVALVEAPAMRDAVQFWRRGVAGFDMSRAFPIAANTGYPFALDASHLLSGGSAAHEIDLRGASEDGFAFDVTLTASRDGTLDGIGGWFVAALCDGVCIHTSPLHPDRIRRRNVFFPLDRPIAVVAGDAVKVSMRVLPSELMVRWTVETVDHRETHSTFKGMLLAKESIDRTAPGCRPALSPRGLARRTVLELCNGLRPIVEIEREVYDRHRTLFRSVEDAQEFVAEVVTAYGC